MADAAREIRSGVASHRAGQFDRAEKSFAEATKEMPNHPVALYDRACSLAAHLGRLDEAEDLFQQTKSSNHSQVVVNSHYNLGCLDSARAKAKFGDKPEEASTEVRQEGIELLEQAVMHYRDCLQLDRNHAAARHNLEVIRLWIKHMSDVWRQRDREKARQEPGLIEFLLMIEQRQRELRRLNPGSADKSQRRRNDAKPQRQWLKRNATCPRNLIHCKRKFAAASQGNSNAGNSPTPSAESARSATRRSRPTVDS